MALVFSAAPGQVTRITSAQPAQRAVIRMANPKFGFAAQSCIVTRVRLGQQVNYQELHTLDEFAYFYNFGDRVSELQVGGLAFLSNCNAEAVSGIGSLLAFFAANKASTRASPLFLQIGDRSFNAFLVRNDVEVMDPDQGLAQFAFDLRAIDLGLPAAATE